MHHRARIEALQRTLGERGLDGALLFQSRDILYYTGTAQPGWLVVTPDDFVLGLRSGLDFARRDTGLEAPFLVVQRDPVTLLKQRFAPGARLGSELDMMSVLTYRRLRAALDGGELVDLSPAILQQRMVKEPEEVAAIRRACTAIDAGHRAALAGVRAGMTELEASAAIEHGHRRAGHEGDYFLRDIDFTMGRGPFASGENLAEISGVVFTISGVGLSPAVPAGASRRVMQPGDLFVVDIPTCVDGYHADQSRTYALGRAPSRALELHAGLLETADRLRAAMRPGWTAGEVYERAQEYAQRAGIGAEFLAFPNGKRAHFAGHGVGLEVNEPPFLSRGSKLELRAGMVLTSELHAWADDGTMVKLEDTLLLGPEGCELLTVSPRELSELDG
jgi:Xaa-Pro aminopeptidase